MSKPTVVKGGSNGHYFVVVNPRFKPDVRETYSVDPVKPRYCAIRNASLHFPTKTERQLVEQVFAEQIPVIAGFPSYTRFALPDGKIRYKMGHEFVEQLVTRQPENYWWILRRFKTRPAGEPPFYQ